MMEICYHVSTLMPNRARFPKFTNKKRHIGNDFVSVVFSDSPLPFCPHTLSGQFNWVHIIVYPLEVFSSCNAGFVAPTTKTSSDTSESSQSISASLYYRVVVVSKPIGLPFAPLLPPHSPLSTISPLLTAHLPATSGVSSSASHSCSCANCRGRADDSEWYVEQIVSAEVLPQLIRQLIIQANLICILKEKSSKSDEVYTNWHERLMQIRRIRDRTQSRSSVHEAEWNQAVEMARIIF
eukprot:TRINITY_DN4257_c0_g1_i2.p1 TRINITY_DN4257_c0_g1~~TRINITY_DN4257_c0_g1_i2.p1  ORF type:complete len:238 (-),score=21.26 TRINITY_DN4257_c0_g1_i2:103-816(-)